MSWFKRRARGHCRNKFWHHPMFSCFMMFFNVFCFSDKCSILLVILNIIFHHYNKLFKTSRKDLDFSQKSEFQASSGCDIDPDSFLLANLPDLPFGLFFKGQWANPSAAPQVRSIESKLMPLVITDCSPWLNGSIPLVEETPGAKVMTASCVAMWTRYGLGCAGWMRCGPCVDATTLGDENWEDLECFREVHFSCT